MTTRLNVKLAVVVVAYAAFCAADVTVVSYPLLSTLLIFFGALLSIWMILLLTRS